MLLSAPASPPWLPSSRRWRAPARRAAWRRRGRRGRSARWPAMGQGLRRPRRGRRRRRRGRVPPRRRRAPVSAWPRLRRAPHSRSRACATSRRRALGRSRSATARPAAARWRCEVRLRAGRHRLGEVDPRVVGQRRRAASAGPSAVASASVGVAGRGLRRGEAQAVVEVVGEERARGCGRSRSPAAQSWTVSR